MRKLILSLLSLILVLTGCSDNNQTSTDTVVIEDAMGSVEVPREPKRIVTLTNESTEALVELGITPVGAVNSWVGDPYYDFYEGKLDGVTPVGLEGQPNLEQIANLQPDLIIGNKMRDEDEYKQLSAIAPTVFSETIRGDWKENFQLYAKAVGKEEEGQAALDDYNQRIDTISKELDAKGLLDPEVTVIRFMDGKTRLYLEDSFTGTIFKDLGINETTIDGSDETFAMEITKEQLLDYAGDAIIYFTFVNNDSDAALDEQKSWLNDPIIQNLDAVKNGHVFKVDDIIWNTGGGVICANLVLDQIEAYATK